MTGISIKGRTAQLVIEADPTLKKKHRHQVTNGGLSSVDRTVYWPVLRVTYDDVSKKVRGRMHGVKS